MPLARFALYQDGLEILLAPTADDSDAWHDSMRHIAREARAYVITAEVFQRASSHPEGVPLADGDDLMNRGGSAILGPDGRYLAGPLWDELRASSRRCATPPASTRSGSASTRPATTTGRTSSGSRWVPSPPLRAGRPCRAAR